MRFAKLKIKPPPTNIPLVVYISTAAIFGILSGISYSHAAEIDFAIGISISISMSVFGFCVKTKKQKITLLIIATFSLFFSRSIFLSSSSSPLWLTMNNGDLVEVEGVVVTTPTTKNRTEGYLSNIDDRPPTTTFEFLASPPTDQSEQRLFTVRVDGSLVVNKGEKIITIGRIRRHPYIKSALPTLFVSQESLIKTIQKNKNVFFEMEHAVKQRILNGINGEDKALVSAIFFGERKKGWRKLSRTFRRAGLSHILAVSGLHVAITVIVIIWILRAASFGKKTSFIVICFVSMFLFSIIESRPPVFRAILTVLIASTLQIRGQRFGGLGILATVASAIVWVEPEVIREAGFILSFITVFGLCVFFPTMQWKLLGPRDNHSPALETIRYATSTLWIVGMCAVLITAPLTMHLFGTIAPIGLFTSISGVFFLFLILLLGIIRLMVGWVYPPLDESLLWCMKTISSQMIEAAKLYGDIPMSFLYTKPLTPLLVILLLTLLSFVIVTTGRIKQKIIIASLITVCMFCEFGAKKTVITTLNVGHGTAHIIEDGDRIILVDAGSRVDLDIGLHKVLPSLRKRGIKKINTLIITHNDLDHCSAILDLMQEIEINEICITPYAQAHQTQVINKIIQVARGKKITINKIVSGWSTKINGGTISALWPEEEMNYTSPNEASVVLSIKSNGRSVLLTGDINEKTISTFLLQPVNRVDVLEMPHHGQWSNESASLLHKTQPLIAIQSTSKTRYTHDKWIIPQNTERLVTCVDGDITTTISKDGEIEIRTSHTNLTIFPQR